MLLESQRVEICGISNSDKKSRGKHSFYVVVCGVNDPVSSFPVSVFVFRRSMSFLLRLVVFHVLNVFFLGVCLNFVWLESTVSITPEPFS